MSERRRDRFRIRTVRAGAVLLLVAFHTTALVSARPLLVLLPVWTCLFIWIVVRCRRPALRLVALNVAAACAVLAAAETWFWLGDRGLDPSSITQTSSHDYKIRHDILGWAPYPSNRREVSKRYRDRVLYDTTYTIDDLGLRLSPPEDPAGVEGTVLFFGGSFTFGEGLADEETLAYRTGILTDGRWRVRNLGFHGYGPQQMLAAIENDLVSPLVAPGGRVVAVYQSALFHARRAAGRVSWRAFMPRYDLQPDGRLLANGFFAEDGRTGGAISRFTSRSFLLDRLFGEGRTGTSREIDLMVAIVAASSDALQQDFPGSDFHVLYWDEASWWYDAKVLSGLQAAGIPTHRVSEVFPTSDLAYRISPQDRHPNAAAIDALARTVVSAILAQDPSDPDLTESPVSAE